jgi:hypothetical protein
MDYVKKHNREALALSKAYASDKPWRGDLNEKLGKLLDFAFGLATAYRIDEPVIVKAPGFGTGKANGFYDPDSGAIVLDGGFSVMAFMRLFAKHLEASRGSERNGADLDTYAARWANGLFMKAFPKSWAKLVARNAAILTRNYS